MGGIYDANGKFEKAYELYKDSLSIYENILGSGHVRVSDVLVPLANLKNTVVFLFYDDCLCGLITLITNYVLSEHSFCILL